jgi:hypothetical protein
LKSYFLLTNNISKTDPAMHHAVPAKFNPLQASAAGQQHFEPAALSGIKRAWSG